MSAAPVTFTDPDAERELIGTCMANPTLAPLAGDKVRVEHFSVLLYGKAFAAMTQVLSEGKQVDEFSLDQKLSGDPLYQSAGGRTFLLEMIGASVPLPRASAIDTLSETITKLALRRGLQHTVEAARERVQDRLTSTNDVLVSLREEITQLEDGAELSQRGMVHVQEIARELTPTLCRLSEKPGEMLGFSTGFHGIDRVTSGFPSGNFGVLAARPSMGKTALALDMGLRVARMGNPVAIFSLETPRDMLELRLVCRHGRIDLASLTSGLAGGDMWKRVAPAIDAVGKFPIYVDDRPRPKATDLRWRIRAAARRFNVKLVIVDYLQLCTAKGDTRNEEIATVSGELQAAARELGQTTGGALLALSQLNRLADGERPRLSHLRDSGAIEQDADSVWFLCEPSGARPGQLEPYGKELDIAKSRNGPTGSVRFDYIPQCMAFEESDR